MGEITDISCIVLAHTRELAFQIGKEFDRFAGNLNFKTMVITGGDQLDGQIEKLKSTKPQIIVGTPGRMLALIKKEVLDTKKVKIFILDECDKMLKELGTELLLTVHRHEIGCSGYLQINTSKETSYDVFCYTTERNKRTLQKVYEQAF